MVVDVDILAATVVVVAFQRRAFETLLTVGSLCVASQKDFESSN